jgi:hypothetical protein
MAQGIYFCVPPSTSQGSNANTHFGFVSDVALVAESIDDFRLRMPRQAADPWDPELVLAPMG